MIIYKTTNLINGKIYVGKDSKNSPSYLGSGKYFKKALQKYGRKNFVKETLDHAKTMDELCEKEIHWIDVLDACDPDIGYNLTKGGIGQHGYKQSPETIAKRVSKTKGQKRTAAQKARMSRAQKGKIVSKEGRRNISKALTGNKYNLGKKHSDETKRKMSASQIGKHSAPKSEETKRRISKTLTGRKFGPRKLEHKLPIEQYDINGNLVETYSNLHEAIEKTGNKAIYNCIKGLSKTSGGFFWKLKT